MSMELTLGNFKGDEASINKNKDGHITWMQTPKTCDPYDEVTFNDQLALVTAYTPGDEKYNYAKVVSHDQADFGVAKYYYVRNRIMAPGGKIIYILDIDALYTYMADIYQLPCVCLRTDSDSDDKNMIDAYVYDAQMPTRAYRSVDVYAATWHLLGTTDFSLDGDSNVIITVG